MADPLPEVEPISTEAGVAVENTASSPNMRLPQKKFFRQRAHANPFSDHLLE